MTNQSLTSKDRKFIRSISDLARCNPFTPERISLEKKILGKDFHPSESVLHKEEEFDQAYPNLQLILNRTRKFLEEKITLLPHHPEPDSEKEKEQLILLSELIKFHLYHQYRIELYEFVEQLTRSGKNRTVPFYSSFEREHRKWSQYLPRSFSFAQNPSHYFAFFYQIQRAFYHVYNMLLGNSIPIIKLRSEVWQSIFTNDLYRYERHLINRMGEISSLITGPSGSGKELVAKAISQSGFIPFDASSRKFERHFHDLFIPINIAAMAQTLVESELFGHIRGAFTGAEKDRIGFFERCPANGTVFLDEIGELKPSLQVKLLRVLQDRQFYRLGDSVPIPFQGRVITATNRHLPTEISKDNFRQDLFFRLCSDTITTPSLKEQIDSSPETMQLLLKFIARKILDSEETNAFTSDVLSWISTSLPADYDWPGNVRQLEQTARGILVKGQNFEPGVVMLKDARPAEGTFAKMESGEATLLQAMQIYTQYIHRDSPSIQETARQLDIDHRTVKKHVNSD